MTSCTVFDSPPGPVDPAIVTALGIQCDLPAEFAVRITCRCGHSSVSLQCEDHLKAIRGYDADAFCRDCGAAGHRCPLEIQAMEVIP
jgi:hypothetical protein